MIRTNDLLVISTVVGLATASAFAQATSSDPGWKLTVRGWEQESTHIGQHQIGETLQEWQEREPVTPGQNQTAISPHRLRETFTEWLQLNQLDLADICSRHNRNDRRMDFSAVCLKLSAIRDTGTGEFYTTDQTGKTVGWWFSGGTVSDYSIDHKRPGLEERAAAFETDPNVKVTRTNEREFTWTFVNGKLFKVIVKPNWLALYQKYTEEGLARHPEAIPSFEEEVDFLTQIYGKPSTAKAVPYHNAFGAQWERSEIVWYAPDGTQIAAFERTGFDQHGQLALVSFRSKDSLEPTQPSKANPYGH